MNLIHLYIIQKEKGRCRSFKTFHPFLVIIIKKKKTV